MSLPPLTNKAIRAYVETLPPDEPCARRTDPQHCIVAEYIAAAMTTRRYRVTVGSAAIDVTVWDGDWRVMEKHHRRPRPALVRLIERFDALPMCYPTPADVLPIFALEATR
jgi:hypothetical protein